MFFRTYLALFYLRVLFHSHYIHVLAPLYTEGHPSPYNTLCEQKHLVNSYAFKHPNLPRIFWSPDYSILTYDGSPIRVSSIGPYINCRIDMAEEKMLEVCQGFTFESLEAHIVRTTNPDDPENWIREDVRNNTPGYSIISDKRNPFWEYEEALLSAILESPKTASKFLMFRNDGRAQPNCSTLFLFVSTMFNLQTTSSGAIWAFFGQAEYLASLIFTAKHPTAPPDRGTELAVILASNSVDAASNVHFFSGYLAIVGVYNKTRHNTGSDKLIARFLPHRIARLLLLYMTIVLPVLRIWAPEIFAEEERISIYQHHLFTYAGQAMQSHHFSAALFQATTEGLSVGLGIADWRQMYKALIRQLIGIDIDDDDEGDSTMDSAFGHSR